MRIDRRKPFALLLSGVSILFWSLGLTTSVRGGQNLGHAGESDGDQSADNANWHTVPSGRLVPTLEMLATQTAGNLRRIRTWKGIYDCRTQQRIAKTSLPVDIAKRLSSRKEGYVLLESNFESMFVIDIKNDSVFNSKKLKSFKYVDEESKQPLVTDITGTSENVAYTPEHFIHFDPSERWPGTRTDSDGTIHPLRMAMREPPVRSRVDNNLEVVSPGCFLGFSRARKFDEEFALMVDSLQGKYGSAAREDATKLIVLSESSSPSGVAYQLDIDFREAQSSPPSLHMRAILSPDSGYNPVSCVFSSEDDGKAKRTRSSIRWSWKASDGLFLPSRFEESVFDKASGSLVWERELELKESSINPVVETSQFSYKALGMEDGDVLADEIEHARYKMVGGKFNRLAEDGLTTTRNPESGRFGKTRIMIMVNVAIVVAVMIVWRWKRRMSIK